ncbi:MAG: hypothetical protein IPK83_14450 [Planctomycetes bacterium]|nr:hypothetical protein [Planctomycetota bacterium]
MHRNRFERRQFCSCVSIQRYESHFTRLTLIDSENTQGEFTDYLQRHPSGQFLYASDSPLCGSFKIRAFQVEADGTLTFISDTFTSTYPLDMAASNNGRWLYSVAGIGNFCAGDNHVVHGFQVDSEVGTLSPIDGTPFFSPGQSPAHVAVTGDDGILLVGHGGDGSIHSFTISPEDGYLTLSGYSIDVGNQGDIGGAIATGDDFLFVTRRYSSTGSPSGMLVFRMNPDGSFFQIGGTIDTHGTASDAIKAWAPPPTSRGDINNDGVVDDLDVVAFVNVLVDTPLDPAHVIRSDLTLDSVADGKDVPVFVDYYLNPILVGACCRPDATCGIVTESDCLLSTPGSIWLGAGTECSECPTPPPVIIEAIPNSNPICRFDGAVIFFSISGFNFSPLANAKLTLSGSPDQIPFLLDVQSSDFMLAGFDITNTPTGLWELVVTNPDNQFGVAPTQYLIDVCP